MPSERERAEGTIEAVRQTCKAVHLAVLQRVQCNAAQSAATQAVLTYSEPISNSRRAHGGI